jgi:hypothetical protein
LLAHHKRFCFVQFTKNTFSHTHTIGRVGQPNYALFVANIFVLFVKLVYLQHEIFY